MGFVHFSVGFLYLLSLRHTAADTCAATTSYLQNILDNTAEAGGGWAPIPCGFYATLALTLPSNVKIGGAHCVGGSDMTRLLTLGACQPGVQQHILFVANGTGQIISNIVFDHSNLTDPSTRSSCAITGGQGSVGMLLENCQFLNINTTNQGFSAIQMQGCTGCVIRKNTVSASGGDALNFNAGTYIITENLVENVGDGCIAMNNNAFGTVSNNVLRSCNLGVGAGPAGSTSSITAATPFTITGNLIEDCDYGVLLGWFAYSGRLGPMNCIVSNNIINRPRSSGIQNNGAPGGPDGAWIVQGNHITHAGFPRTQPPHTTSLNGTGNGIVAIQLRDVQILGNQISHGAGVGITAETASHYIIANNIVQADNTANTGISVRLGVDSSVSNNNIRGFANGIVLSDISQRITVQGNTIDASSGPSSIGISVQPAVQKFLLSGNTVSGAGANMSQCYDIVPKPGPYNIERDDVCW
eukprot:m.346632 g.346632  ORF g.346632 m.346632 type:complete len:470 (+) comp29660_c0_seq1:90-1499(+)